MSRLQVWFEEVKGLRVQEPETGEIFRIMDVKLNQWRSFRSERVISVRANGVTTVFTQEDN